MPSQKRMRIAIYTRVSTDEQAKEGYSIGEQKERLLKYAEAMDWIVTGIYEDAGYSGGNMDRPALQQMLRDLKTNLFSAVLVYKQDRLSRRQLDFLTLVENVFQPADIRLISLTEQFDLSNPSGMMMSSSMAGFAQYERAVIKERTMMGKAAKAKTGAWMGSCKPPRGYTAEHGQLRIYQPEAHQIQEAYRLLLEGKPLRTIEKTFHEQGYRHRDGEWSCRTLGRVLRSKVYIGYNQHKGEWYKGTHEPLVSQEVWDSAQDILLQNASRHSKIRRGRHTHYLSGLVRCKRCQAKYGAKRIDSKLANGEIKKRIYYQCYSRSQQVRSLATQATCDNRSWREDYLNDVVFEQIRQLIPTLTSRCNISQGESQAKELRKELKSIEQQSKKLLSAFMLGVFTDDEVAEQKRSLNLRRDHLEKRLSDIENGNRDLQKVIKTVKRFDDVVKSEDFHAIRSLIEGLIDTVWIDGDRVEIEWRF